MGYTARDLATRARRRVTPQQETQPMVLTPDFESRPVISFHRVFKTDPAGTEALPDINLEVPEGDFLFPDGPSGAGKSTLVRPRLPAGEPSEGQVRVGG